MLIKLCLEKIEVEIVAFEITDRAEFRQFKLVQGDTAPAVRVQFLDDIDTPVDITDYTINFHFRKADECILLNEGHTECSIVDAANGIAQYDWVSGDTVDWGLHFGEFQLTTDTGRIQSIRDKLRFEIRPQIDMVSGVWSSE